MRLPETILQDTSTMNIEISAILPYILNTTEYIRTQNTIQH